MDHEITPSQQQRRQQQDQERQPAREVVYLCDEWCGQLLDPRQKPADAPDLGRLARRHHQPARRSLGDQRARPQHRPAVAQGGIGGDGGLALFHRHRLASQDRLLRRKAPCLDHPQVGGHLVSRLQKNDVTGHKVGSVHRYPQSIAQHSGLGRQHVADRGHGGFGLALLDEADDRVGQHHGQDHAGIDPMLQGPRHQRSTDQHINQHMVELSQESDHRPARLHWRQAVGPMFGQPPRSFRRNQAIRRCGQADQAVGGGGGMRVGDVHHRAV